MQQRLHIADRCRFLVVHLPAFRLERCGYEAIDLVALLAERKSAMRIEALTPAAQAEGLRIGMTATEARALVPEVVLLPFDEEAEEQDRIQLCQAFERFTDRLAAGESELILEISKTSVHAGGEEALRDAVRSLAAELGHESRVGIADDPLAAAALALWADHHDWCAPPGEGRSKLAPLPFEALRPSQDLLRSLLAVGIRTIGPWANLHPSSVAQRFGPEGTRLHRVARGEHASVLQWARDDESRPSVRALMAGATSTQQIHFVLPGLLARLCELLNARDLAVLRLRVVLRLETGWGDTESQHAVFAHAPEVFWVRTGRPTRHVPTLERLIRARLEKVELQAPVEEFQIECVDLASERGWQPGLTDRKEATEPLPELLARLVDHLGDQALFCTQPADCWKPEKAWQPMPFPPPSWWSPKLDPRSLRESSNDPVWVQEAWEAPAPAPRPLVLSERPGSIEVQVSAGRITRVSIEGRWHAAQESVGPERLSGSWWSTEGFDRDYWVVSLPQGRAWIYRDRERSRRPWFLHGWFD